MTFFPCTCDFAAGDTVSTAAELDGGVPVALLIPPDWSDGSVTFSASLDGATFYDVVGVGPGVGFVVPADAGAWVPLVFGGLGEGNWPDFSRAEWVSLRGAAYLRLTASVPQANPCTVTVVCEG